MFVRCSSSSFKKVDVILCYLFLHKPQQNIVWMNEYNCNNQDKRFNYNLWRKLKYKLKIPVISKQDLKKELTETSYSKYLHLLERGSFAPWRNGKEYNGLQDIHYNPSILCSSAERNLDFKSHYTV